MQARQCNGGCHLLRPYNSVSAVGQLAKRENMPIWRQDVGLNFGLLAQTYTRSVLEHSTACSCSQRSCIVRLSKLSHTGDRLPSPYRCNARTSNAKSTFALTHQVIFSPTRTASDAVTADGQHEKADCMARIAKACSYWEEGRYRSFRQYEVPEEVSVQDLAFQASQSP